MPEALLPPLLEKKASQQQKGSTSVSKLLWANTAFFGVLLRVESAEYKLPSYMNNEVFKLCNREHSFLSEGSHAMFGFARTRLEPGGRRSSFAHV